MYGHPLDEPRELAETRLKTAIFCGSAGICLAELFLTTPTTNPIEVRR
jgi:hypothetical protein